MAFAKHSFPVIATPAAFKTTSRTKMAEESRMNLSALQQRDPYITGIVDTASQVALYSFNHQTTEWVSVDIF